MTPAAFADWLGRRVRILDAAMGSELLRRGVDSAARLWGVGALEEAAAAVREVHRDHAAAGAEALTAATFRVAPYALRGHGGAARASALAASAVGLARAGAADAGAAAVVLASQTTLEDCYRPDLVPAADVLAREHAATAEALAAAAPDALLLETFNTVREAEAAAAAATATGLATVVSFACRDRGRLLSGEDAGTAAAAVSVPGVVAVGVNCTAVSDVEPALERMAERSPLPLVAYANDAWWADDSPWLEADRVAPADYAARAERWAALGASLIGGCCGTSPAHVAALAARLRGDGAHGGRPIRPHRPGPG